MRTTNARLTSRVQIGNQPSVNNVRFRFKVDNNESSKAVLEYYENLVLRQAEIIASSITAIMCVSVEPDDSYRVFQVHLLEMPDVGLLDISNVLDVLLRICTLDVPNVRMHCHGI